jgi:glutamate synthase (NADPH) large chain
MHPHPIGLYDPRHEHDACGIGAVARISGRKDHAILDMARDVLMNMQHRGAKGGDESTGDGAGILFQIPDEFFASEAERLGFALPPTGHYGVAMVFLPQDRGAAETCETCFAEACRVAGMNLLGWRDVPTQNRSLGELALLSEPRMRQAFVDGCGQEGETLERGLFLVRKRAERWVQEAGDFLGDFYISSCSARTVVYKGMFLAPQLFDYFPDLAEPTVASALAVVHQRYSTNTFPSWRLAQPFRMVAHNGEINTLRGNINLMRAVESSMDCPAFGQDLGDLFPIVQPGGSDSAAFDNALELLVQAGRSLPHGMMMMIPEAFPMNRHVGEDLRGFYEYHGALMEPWDGPAAMIFTDGVVVGGTLDRSGLRPCRYVVTTDGLLVMASEAGVIPFPPERIRTKGKLGPGRMILVDTAEGRILKDYEIKSRISRQKPYRRWLEQNRITLRGLLGPGAAAQHDEDTIAPRLRAFGYTQEDLDRIVGPMAVSGQEPVGSMGTDTPVAVLSDRPRLLFDYFKQMFAQVTNPPLDSQWEGLVMSLLTFAGRHHNVLEESPEHCRMLELQHPILSNEDMARLQALKRSDFKVVTLDMTFAANPGNPGKALEAGISMLLASAERAIKKEDASMLILSDRNEGPDRLPIPCLLAVSALHEHLLVQGLLGAAGFVVESGEPREVAHIGLLCGFGASGVNPYLALESISYLMHEGQLQSSLDLEVLHDNYVLALKKGLLKIMSKMGISTLPSYRGAQLFQALGLDQGFVDTYFPGISSPIGGVGLEVIAQECLLRHQAAYGPREPGVLELDHGGEYSWRKDGERHLWSPEAITLLQRAVRNDDQESYRGFAGLINRQSPVTLRSLMEFVPGVPVPLEEVESAESIVKRFCTGAMSHGSLSKEAHETLAIAMNRLGGASNTGEGGEDPARYTLQADGLDRNCAIKQVASARFGVTIEYLTNAKEIQIKMAQGAKPGEGGQLPGHKVAPEIARLRHSTPGVTLISPPPHHDIYSIEELAQLIYDLRCGNPAARISVKLVSEVGVGTVAAGVAKAGADEVLISGFDGGTGASPLSSIKHAGMPWEIGLAEAQQTLVLNGLRDRITLQTDGQLRTGRDVVVAALLGAERFGFGAGALVSLGCILLRKCHEGNCTAGIATQREELRCHFAGKPEHVERYMLFMAGEVRELMAELGFRRFEDMVGRVDRLAKRQAIEHWKAKGLDFSALLAESRVQEGQAIRCTQTARKTFLADHLDWGILERLRSSLETGRSARMELSIRNVHRSVGTILSHHITKLYGGKGLPDGTLELHFRGSAGQSFGAFLTNGMTLVLEGEANDHLGKGLCGGRIVVKVPEGSTFPSDENYIAGNSLLYGATGGEAFLNGLAGERFAVRNSGAFAVVEGVGDHGCEYMTGGVVVVLGRTGRNFAAGMTGGIAYVLDEHQIFDTQCSLDTVLIEGGLGPQEALLLRAMVERHVEWTQSKKGKKLLETWPDMVGRFVKVIPLEYGQALRQSKLEPRSVIAVNAQMIEEVVSGKA